MKKLCFTYGIRESRERDPSGDCSCVWIFLQNEYAGYYDSDAHYHDPVDPCNHELNNVYVEVRRTSRIARNP